jgi:hypothetical protein
MLKLFKNVCRFGAFALAIFLAGSAFGAMTLPGGDIFGTGDFAEIGYGANGLAYVNPFLYVGDLASTDSPKAIADTTNLTYDYGFSVLGTPLLTLTYSIKNDDPADFNDLRFIVKVQADGEQINYMDTVNRMWGPNSNGEPDHFQVDEFFGNLGDKIVANNGLDDSDLSQSMNPLDVDFALQWDLATLAPGQEWIITVGLADDGTSLSPNRYLQAAGLGDPDTELTFSGEATVVPIPSALLLLSSSLIGLAGFRRKFRK